MPFQPELERSPSRDALRVLLRLLAPRPEASFLMKWKKPDGRWTVLVVDRSLPPSEGALMLLADRQGWRTSRKGGGPVPANFWGVVTWLLDRP